MPCGPGCGIFDADLDGDVDTHDLRVFLVLLDGRADFDHDLDIDADDWTLFAACLAGPGVPPATGCGHADLDADGDVDLADAAIFQAVFTGPRGGGSAAVPPNPYLFTGRRVDCDLRDTDGSITGQPGRPLLVLYDYRAREYDPWHGRFTSRDPAFYADSLNLYQYALSNPQVFADPRGTWSLGEFLGSAATTAWMVYNVADTALGIKDFVQALADLLSARSLTYDAYLAVGIEGAFLLGDKLLGPVDEVVGLARGLRAVRAAKAGRNIAEWTTKELGDAIKNAGGIEDFLKAIDEADFDLLWRNGNLRNVISREIRQPRGMHEWIQVSLLPQLMERPDKAFWIDAMRSIRKRIDSFAEVHASTRFHNELRAAYREGMSLDEYLQSIAEIARRWGVDFP